MTGILDEANVMLTWPKSFRSMSFQSFERSWQGLQDRQFANFSCGAFWKKKVHPIATDMN